MTFLCPRCQSRLMRIESSIELLPDSRSDEITVQILKCPKCGFTGLGIYEETRRGRLDTELIHHRGYCLNDSTMVSIEKLIKQCPKPRNPNCKCKTHNSFYSVDEFGRWNWLKKIPLKEEFKLLIV